MAPPSKSTKASAKKNAPDSNKDRMLALKAGIKKKVAEKKASKAGAGRKGKLTKPLSKPQVNALDFLGVEPDVVKGVSHTIAGSGSRAADDDEAVRLRNLDQYLSGQCPALWSMACCCLLLEAQHLAIISNTTTTNTHVSRLPLLHTVSHATPQMKTHEEVDEGFRTGGKNMKGYTQKHGPDKSPATGMAKWVLRQANVPFTEDTSKNEAYEMASKAFPEGIQVNKIRCSSLYHAAGRHTPLVLYASPAAALQQRRLDCCSACSISQQRQHQQQRICGSRCL
jgi:hypothetical protein